MSASATPPPRTPFTTGHFRPAMTDADRRASAQQHLDARSQRITDYAASLETALATASSAPAAEILLRRLTQARQDLAASRPRLAAPAAPSARSIAARGRRRVTEPAVPPPDAPVETPDLLEAS